MKLCSNRPFNRSPGIASAGFTLVELLIVITIIAVLAAIAFTGGRSALRSAAVATCNNNLRQIGVGLAQHQADLNRYPSANESNTWDRAILPYLGYSGARSIIGTASFDSKKWSELQQPAKIFKCTEDSKKRGTNRFARSYAIVPWTTNWSNGTSFRGWKDRPFNVGIPALIVPNPSKAAMVVEWSEGTEGVAPNELGSGAHAYHDCGGPATKGLDLHREKQIVLFADGHTESLPILSTDAFVAKYWPGKIGNVN